MVWEEEEDQKKLGREQMEVYMKQQWLLLDFLVKAAQDRNTWKEHVEAECYILGMTHVKSLILKCLMVGEEGQMCN